MEYKAQVLSCCTVCAFSAIEEFLSPLISWSDDLFELVWHGGGGGGLKGQPSCKRLPLSRPAAAVAPVPEILVPPLPAPPSEAQMASWLFPIVSAGGRDATFVAGPVDDDQMVPSGKESSDHKLQEKRKTSSTAGRRRSHPHAEAHSLTEKRRRCKIKEKLKTLQQLVPGCDNNSNQASTLDQTIRYMKSLQQHIQAMSSFGCGMKPASVAVYPVVQQAPSVPCWSLPCWCQGEHRCRGSLLGASPAIIPFCDHVFHGFTFTTLQSRCLAKQDDTPKI